MLKCPILFLVLATSLWSQDLLVDSIDREFSGTLIEITATDIHFHIEGETSPVQYPHWAVTRVTLADGRVAFEDGKVLVANPTRSPEPEPSVPTPTVTRPIERQPAIGEPEVELATPPPALAPQPAERAVAATGPPPAFTQATLMTMAQDNARMNHDTRAWKIGGGLAGCAGLWLGTVLGTAVGGGVGFIIGAGLSAAFVAEGLAYAYRPNSPVPLPEALDPADGQLQEQYRQLYRAETHNLRKEGVNDGMQAWATTACIGILAFSIVLGAML